MLLIIKPVLYDNINELVLTWVPQFSAFLNEFVNNIGTCEIHFIVELILGLVWGKSIGDITILLYLQNTIQFNFGKSFWRNIELTSL